jgi:hypothetical protein
VDDKAPKSNPPMASLPPTARETRRVIVDEYGELLSSGGYQTWNTEPYIERIYPLAEKIRAHRRRGKVYRRRIIVIEDWTEVDAP